ncbi:J domain-containing protein [Clostridium tyrobutyricum]|uniref:J domain-containing protein n=1 Tax=Clostridium tyrobutyricum TaxID=1519 RepID=UPI001C381C29|nr:J domain-containing protein [Clostridium tyrobutyricum]MBV4416990.1 DnaJ domain-containing protein [Clostridium tyrobutyricum]
MKNYFENIKTVEELKEKYRKLALKYHPDMGGTNEEMSEINNQYDVLFKKLKEGNQESPVDDGFREVINKIINLNVKIEICGSWIWVSGDTKPYRKELKLSGLWWANKKKMWYWHSKEDRKKRRSNMSMQEIREKYGTKTVNNAMKVIA